MATPPGPVSDLNPPTSEAPPAPASRGLPGSRSRRRPPLGSRSTVAQSPPQSARSGQCNARSRPVNCRRNSSSASGPTGGGSHQGSGRSRGSTRRPPRSSRTVASAQYCGAVLSPLQSSQSRQLGRQPRAQRPEVRTRGAPGRRLREGAVPAAGRASVRLPLRLRPGASVPFPYPQPHRRTPYPKVSRSPATVAPSMVASAGDPGRAPLSAGDRLHPEGASSRPTRPLSNHILVRRSFGAPIGSVARHVRPSGNLSRVENFTA